MSDPWKDVRERLEKRRGIWLASDIIRLLTDADALLAVVKKMPEWHQSDNSDEPPYCVICGFYEPDHDLHCALAALSPHLRGDVDG